MKLRTPLEHEQYNATHYPGTRQLCVECNQPTDRCEDDSIYLDNGHGPLCEECYHKSEEYTNAIDLEALRAENAALRAELERVRRESVRVKSVIKRLEDAELAISWRAMAEHMRRLLRVMRFLDHRAARSTQKGGGNGMS